MKKYENATIMIITVHQADVISTSGPDPYLPEPEDWIYNG